MSDPERKLVFDCLMRGIPSSDPAYFILEGGAAEQVNDLETVIEAIFAARLEETKRKAA